MTWGLALGCGSGGGGAACVYADSNARTASLLRHMTGPSPSINTHGRTWLKPKPISGGTHRRGEKNPQSFASVHAQRQCPSLSFSTIFVSIALFKSFPVLPVLPSLSFLPERHDSPSGWLSSDGPCLPATSSLRRKAHCYAGVHIQWRLERLLG